MSEIPYPLDRAGLERILSYANADLSNEEDVAGLARWGESFPEIGAVMMPNWPVPPVPLDQKTKGSQKKLVSILDELVENGGCTDSVDQRLDKSLRRISDLNVLCSVRGVTVLYTVKTVAQWYSFGIAALKSAGMDDLVRRCKYPRCNKFFVAWPGGRGRAGKKRVYCCDTCRNTDKSRRKRERDRRAAASRGIAI